MIAQTDGPGRRKPRLALLQLEDRTVPAVTAAGAEFPVNTTTANRQITPAVAADPAGNAVAAWDSVVTAGADDDIRLQFAAGGAAGGDDAVVNTTTADVQSSPDVGRDATGNTVVVFQSFSNTNDQDVFFQRYNGSGVAQGAQTIANTTLPDGQRSPRVGVAADGSFVVSWIAQSDNADSTINEAVVVRRFSAAGAPLTAEVTVATLNVGVAAGVIEFADVASADNGNFVVAYASTVGGNLDVLARRYQADGTARDPMPVPVNTVLANTQRLPSVAVDADGDYYVAWQSAGSQDGAGVGIFGRRFNDAGAAQDMADVQVNATTAGDQTNPSAAVSNNGVILVAFVTPANARDVIVQQISQATGMRDGAELVVTNDSQANAQTNPAVAVGDDGTTGFVVWQDNTRDMSLDGIFGQRLAVTGGVSPPPAPVNDAATVAQGAMATTINVLANDVPAAGLTVTAVTPGANGATVAVGANGGSVTYTPAAAFSGADSFTYTVTDASNRTATATVNVTVTPAPAPVNDTATVAQNAAPTTINVLANDAPAGLTVTAVTQGANGATVAVATGGGSVTYAPAAGFSGADSFTYTVQNAGGQTATATVNVTVTAAPVPVNDAVTVANNSGANTLNVLANDAPATGLTVSAVTPAASGTAAVGANAGSVTYAPNPGFSGTDTFTYTVRNAGGQTATATVTVTVTPAPTPVPVNDTATVAQNAAPTTINVLANDAPATGLTVSAVTQGARGTAAVGANGGSVTYTPTAGLSGTDTFTYTARNATGQTATATVTVTVTPDTTPPTVTSITPLGPVPATGATLDFRVVFSEPVTGVDAGDFSVTQGAGATGAAVQSVSGSATTFTVTVATGTTSGTVGLNVAAGGIQDLSGNGTAAPTTGAPVAVAPVANNRIAVGAGAGGGRVVLADATTRNSVLDRAPFGSGFAGGIRVATDDFNADGIPDLVAGTGPGAATQVVVLDGATGNELFRVSPFEAAFTGGVYVSAGDLTGDGRPDLVVSPDEGGGPRVQVYTGAGFGKVADFFGIDDTSFRGGARTAVGDFNGDLRDDLVVAAGFGGGPRVVVYNGATVGGTPAKLVSDFFLFEPALRNGAFVAAGDINGDGRDDLVGGGGPGGGPRVLALSGVDLVAGAGGGAAVLANFFAGNPDNRGGVRVATSDLDGDARADLVVGDGDGAGNRVTGFLGKDFAGSGAPENFATNAFPGFNGGVFVG